MGIKKSAAAYSQIVLASLIATQEDRGKGAFPTENSQEDLEKIAELKAAYREAKQIELNKKKGLSYYEFDDGFSCWALNHKSADKKHKKHQNEAK